jgi:hypothetical protein
MPFSSTYPFLILTMSVAGCTSSGSETRCHLLRGNGHQPVLTAWDVPPGECEGKHVLETVDERGRVTSLRFREQDRELATETHFPTAVDFAYSGDGVTVSYPGRDDPPTFYRFRGGELLECRAMESVPGESPRPGPARCQEIRVLDYSQAKIDGVAPLAWGYVPPPDEIPIDERAVELEFAARCHLFRVVDGTPRVSRWDVGPDDCRGHYITERVDEAGYIRVVEFWDGDSLWRSAGFPASFRYTYGDEGLGVAAANADGHGVDASQSMSFAGRYRLRDGQIERCTTSFTATSEGVASPATASESCTANAALQNLPTAE